MRAASNIVITILIAVAGCRPPESVHEAHHSAAERNAPSPQEALPKLRTLDLFIGPARLEAEMAQTEKEVQTGMMFRTNILDSEGMLFIFPRPQQVGFWMKNTVIPLSCAYINESGRIEEIHPLEPLNTNAVLSSSYRIQFVLETARGWFERHQVTTGALIRSARGDLRKELNPAR